VPLDGRTAIVIDDGIATGATARAACQIARAKGAQSVVLAVPIAPPDTARALLDVADEVVCVDKPATLSSIGQWYHDFSQTPDEEVIRLLDAARTSPVEPADVTVHAGSVTLPGELTVPAGASGIVVYAHGSGSGRTSPRNLLVARAQHELGLATLLFDLLTPDEALQRANVFDIGLLAKRVLGAIEWVRTQPVIGGLPLGLFGASTGAAAALWAAAEPSADVRAVVSRGGRPDLAAEHLGDVSAPTLLIVGGADLEVLALNRHAQGSLRCPNRLEVVPGATHLFEEPGALDIVAQLAADWFHSHLRDV
jgi:putative phosphoribosyl transferase